MQGHASSCNSSYNRHGQILLSVTQSTQSRARIYEDCLCALFSVTQEFIVYLCEPSGTTFGSYLIMAVLNFDIQSVPLASGEEAKAVFLSGSIDASTNQTFENRLGEILSSGTNKDCYC